MNRNVILFYLTFSIFSSIVMYLLPLLYIDLGYSEVQIGILTSMFTIAAIFSPLFGYFAENRYTSKKVITFSSIVVIISLVFLFFIQSFMGVLLCVTLYAVFQSPMFGLTDIFVTSYTEKYKLNFGNFKRFASLGWGIGVLFAVPFMFLLGIKGFIIATILFVAFFMILLNKSEEVVHEKVEETNYIADFKKLLSNKQYLLILSVSCLFWGTTRLRISYQSILMTELTDQSFYIALMTFFMIVPEIIILPFYPRIRKRFNFSQQMLIVMGLTTIMLLLFSFSESPIVVTLATGLHGAMAAIYFPCIIFAVRQCVDKNMLVTSMLVLGSLLSIATFLVSLFIVTPIYANFGLQYVFVSILVLSFLTVIPLFFLRKLRV